MTAGKSPTRKWLLVGGLALLASSLCISALSQNLTVRTYVQTTPKVTEPVRLAVLADLHGTQYGEGQAELLALLQAQAPDGVVLLGDLVDEETARETVWPFLEALCAMYPCYYVSGNHEFWTEEIAEIKARIRACGVTVLEGESALLSVRGQTVRLCGADDPQVGEAVFQAQLEACGRQAGDGVYTVLLAHRPERAAQYVGYAFDLVLAGHAHGGQVRIPGILNGLYAPYQGWFPKYAGGAYALEDTTMVVSRGLVRGGLPRIWNPPELVMVEIAPEEE